MIYSFHSRIYHTRFECLILELKRKTLDIQDECDGRKYLMTAQVTLDQEKQHLLWVHQVQARLHCSILFVTESKRKAAESSSVEKSFSIKLFLFDKRTLETTESM